ncbi:hypothetical protein Syun_000017 [Stephania yunnanensis]|uniref:Acid phosphatase n=1 Tax=Stephania yunnanensis TaxID=152371 RepID=A0AAP0LB36_9MAGN
MGIARAWWVWLLVVAVGALGSSRLCSSSSPTINNSSCLSWRLAVEANNARAWRTVPPDCHDYVGSYMTGGQYQRDLDMVVQQITAYITTDLQLSNNNYSAWILDVDDTCLSNVLYYRRKRFGCDPYDPTGFRSWAAKGASPAVPAIHTLFRKLVTTGFKVFLITGRDGDSLAHSTTQNLHTQGYTGYQRLFMRNSSYKGQSAVAFKSEIRKQLVDQGYKILGNVGDQWSDLAGDCAGERTFKIPNPMYFVP